MGHLVVSTQANLKADRLVMRLHPYYSLEVTSQRKRATEREGGRKRGDRPSHILNLPDCKSDSILSWNILIAFL